MEQKQQVIGYDEILPPTFEIPIKDVQLKIQDVDDLKLTVTDNTDPYLITPMPTEKCCCCSCAPDQVLFYFVRGPLFVLSFLWGFMTGIWHFFIQLFCGCCCTCASTYHILSDEDFTSTFRHKVPYMGFVTTDSKENVFDATVMSKLEKEVFPGYYTTGTKTRWDQNWQLVGIEIKGQLVTPHDDNQDAWKLAKLYVMHNVHYFVKFMKHPFLHFSDAGLVAAFNKYVPRNSPIQQLLKSHLKFARLVTDFVLNGSETVINGGSGTFCCWDAQDTDRDSIAKLVRDGSRPPGSIMRGASEYRSLQPYYEVITVLVSDIMKSVISGNRLFAEDVWPKIAQDLHHYSGYPENMSVDRCRVVLTDFIFRVTVQHSAEHYALYNAPYGSEPMAISKEWTPDVKLDSGVVSKWSSFKANYYNHMFVGWWNNLLCYDTRLCNVEYGFESPELQKSVTKFKRDLENIIPNEGDIPLSSIASSIEW